MNRPILLGAILLGVIFSAAAVDPPAVYPAYFVSRNKNLLDRTFYRKLLEALPDANTPEGVLKQLEDWTANPPNKLIQEMEPVPGVERYGALRQNLR